MNMKFTLVEIMIILAILGLLLIVPGIWVFRSHMEAKAYQNITGVKVSTWDAMWVELRVQTGPGTQEK